MTKHPTHRPREPTVQSERMGMLLRDKTEAAHTLLTHGWEAWRIALVLGWSRAKIERVLAGAVKLHGPHVTHPRRPSNVSR